MPKPKIFFTSDTHFGHANIIKYCKRPFDSLQQMDAELIGRWNGVVGEKDTVYHLGDFTLRDAGFAGNIFRQLNGNILVLGNHQHHDKKWIPKHFGETRFETATGKVRIMPPIVVLNFPELSKTKYPQGIVLCHFAMAKWDRAHYGSWHLYGHSHGEYDNGHLSIDVGVDCHDFRPVPLDRVAEIMRARDKEVLCHGCRWPFKKAWDPNPHTKCVNCCPRCCKGEGEHE